MWLQGSFYEPTVISGATTDMKIFREETFGPAIPLFKFDKDEEAVQLANNTEYGLAAYFWTKVNPKIRHTTRPCTYLRCTHSLSMRHNGPSHMGGAIRLKGLMS